MSDTAALPIRYDAMCRAIAEAHAVDEVKDIRDKALAIEIYSRQARNIENEKRAIEIRMRAERRCGELSRDIVTAQGRRSDIETLSHAETKSDVLAAAGITRQQAARWEKLAAIPQEEFEATFRGPSKPSTSGILAKAQPKQKNAVDDRALWLWGRLLDFERDGLLEENPSDVCESMLPHMKDTVRELAPRVAKWLEEIEI